MSMKPKKISQSLMKALGTYVYKIVNEERIDAGDSPSECGKYFYAKYFEDAYEEPTPAQNLGNWFEFICTGQLPRTGLEPIPKTLKTGKLSVDYTRMEKQAENFKKLMDFHNFKIIESGYTFNNHKDLTGIADIIAKDANGKICVIDIKSTGLIDDIYKPYGWGLERIEEKPDLLIQAVQYSVLAKNEFKQDVDFYFALFSTKNENKYRLIKVNLTEESIANHKVEYEFALNKIDELFKNNSFKAVPSYDRCSNCFLKDSCSDAIKIPSITEIYY